MYSTEVVDGIRLIALPILLAAAVVDLRTRRIANKYWLAVALIGAVALAGDLVVFLLDLPAHRPAPLRIVILTLVMVVPTAFGLWSVGAIGGADAKAMMALAIAFPLPPRYVLPPILTDPTGLARVFPIISWTGYSPAVTAIGISALIAGLFVAIKMASNHLLGCPEGPLWPSKVHPEVALRSAGRLFDPGLSEGGVDMDIAHAFLDWKGVTLKDLRTDKTSDSIPLSVDGIDLELFTRETEIPLYGTTPKQLGETIQVLATRSEVELEKGVPYVISLTLGLAITLILGDAILWVLIVL